MKLCNGVDENFEQYFVINIGYYITEVCITNRAFITNPYKNFHNNRDIFYDEKVLIFFKNTIAKPHAKRLRVAFKQIL